MLHDDNLTANRANFVTHLECSITGERYLDLGYPDEVADRVADLVRAAGLPGVPLELSRCHASVGFGHRPTPAASARVRAASASATRNDGPSPRTRRTYSASSRGWASANVLPPIVASSARTLSWKRGIGSPYNSW